MSFSERLKQKGKRFKDTLNAAKTRLAPSRSQSPDSSISPKDEGATESGSPLPSPPSLGRRSDTAALFKLNDPVNPKSSPPAPSDPSDSKVEVDDDTPTIAVEEAPAPTSTTVISGGPMKQTSVTNSAALPPVQSTQESGPPKRRFAQSGSPQQDITVLHVAYIVRDSREMQELSFEIVRISTELDFKDVLKPAVSFATKLVAALDMNPIPNGTNEAISSFLVTMKTIDINESPDKAFQTVQQSIEEIECAYPDLDVVHRKHSNRFSTIASGVLGVSLPLVAILQDASSMIPVPMVQPLIGVVAGFMKAADEASNNFEWMRWLAATAAEYIVRIAIICPRDIDKRWTKAIENLDEKLSKIVKDAAEFSRRSVISRFLTHAGDNGEISRMKDVLRTAIDLFNMEVQINIKLDLDTMSRNIESLLLENLPRLPSHKISHDRYFRASREKEIRETLEWVEADDGERFLWIHGAAGVGKSTYARRLFDHIKEEGMLGAFAYFAIGIDSDPKDLVRMMARELASLHPGCRYDVVRAIKECSGVHQRLDEYITHYLVRPISTLSYSGPLVVILDALDEWAYREEFLTAIVRKIRFPGTTSLKFVMTSRYSTGINTIVQGNVRIRELTPVSETICREYFEDRFQTLQWEERSPDSHELDQLVAFADGLLIWAATVCSLVSIEDPRRSHYQILSDILASSSTVVREQRMTELYKFAMERIFPNDRFKEARRDIVLAMVALREALPLTEFALLVDVRPPFVQSTCVGLRALQTRGVSDESMVQPTIKIFHASFVDYFGTLQEARTVITRHCVSFFKRLQYADKPLDIGANLFRHAELYMGKHFAEHILEAPTDLQSQAVAEILSDHLRMWMAWSLAHLMVIGEENGFCTGSQVLQTMAKSLLDDAGIIYSPELMTRNDDQLLSTISSFQKVLKLAGLDWGDPRSSRGAQDPILYQTDAKRWVHVVNSIAIGLLQVQMVQRFEADRPNITRLESSIGHLEAISKTFDMGCPLSVLQNLALALEERFRYNGAVEDLERAIALHETVQERMSKGATGYTTFLLNFGKALHSRFQHVGSPTDLDRSISLLQEALTRDTSIHHKRPTILDNLGLALHTRYLLRDPSESPTPISEVVNLHQEAFSLRSKHASHAPLLLNNLSYALQSKFQQTKDAKLLETAFFHVLQATSTKPLGNLEYSMYTTTLSDALRLIQQAKIDPCSNVPSEYSDLSKMELLDDMSSVVHPSSRNEFYVSTARKYYRRASKALPSTAPSRWLILSSLGTALLAWATVKEELDLRYVDEAIFLYQLIQRRQHVSHFIRILSEKYLQSAYETLRAYNIPCPDLNVSPEQEEVSSPEKDPGISFPLFTSEGKHCIDRTRKVYKTHVLTNLCNYVKDSDEPVILYRFSSEAFEEIWRPCSVTDLDFDSSRAIDGLKAIGEDTLETIPVLWNVICAAKYLAIEELSAMILLAGPARLSGRTYHEIVACFQTRKPWKFEHQFIYMKDEDQAMPRQDVPKDVLVSPELVGGALIKSPFAFAVVFYLASHYHVIPPLQSLANVISTHQHDASEVTGRLAKELFEIIPLLGPKKDDVMTLLASCSSTAEKLKANPDGSLIILEELATSLHEGVDALKASNYPQDGSSSARPRFSDVVVDIERFFEVSPDRDIAFNHSDIFHRALSTANISLVQPLLNVLLQVCDRYFRSTIRLEEEIYFIMLLVLANLSSGVAFVLSDGRHPPDGRLYHAICELSESLQTLLTKSPSVDDLTVDPLSDIIYKFRRQVYDRSQLARSFVVCMASIPVVLWQYGWEVRWYYAQTPDQPETTYGADSDLETTDDEKVGIGEQIKLKFDKNLRLGARRKLRTARPLQVRQKKAKAKEDDEGSEKDDRSEKGDEPDKDKETDGGAKSEESDAVAIPESIVMPVPQPYEHDGTSNDWNW